MEAPQEKKILSNAIFSMTGEALSNEAGNFPARGLRLAVDVVALPQATAGLAPKAG